MVEPTRKSTRVTVAPPKAAALAVSVGDVPSATEAPLAWLAAGGAAHAGNIAVRAGTVAVMRAVAVPAA